MVITPHDSTGTTFSFGGTSFTVTNIVVNFNNPAAEDVIDVSHLGLLSGASVLTQSRPLTGSASDTGQEVTIEYLGKTLIADQTTGTLEIVHAGVTLLSRGATVNSTTLTFATNDAVRGSNTFAIERD